MHTFLDNLRQGGKYSAQIASHQGELRREGKFTDQNNLFTSALKNDYLNLTSSSSCGKNSDISNTVNTK